MEVKNLSSVITLRQFRNFLSNTNVTRRFAEKHNLVYFGTINQDDESRLVKGITVSNSHRDTHYLVGTTHGRDLIFLQRKDILRQSMQKRRESYNWNILAIDLSQTLHLPHVYIEGNARHGKGFYETLSMKKREFSELPYGFLSAYDPLFAKRYIVRLSAAAAHEFARLLTPERAAVIAHHFSHFDFEWHDDVLYVYYLSSRPTLGQLDLMLQAGVWLANELDFTQQSLSPTL